MSREPCTSGDGSPKRAYESKHKAESAARRTNQATRNDMPAVAYKCPDGGHFHVGHPFEEELHG